MKKAKLPTNDYPYLRLYCDYIGVDQDYKKKVLEMARDLKAPETTIYFRGKFDTPVLADTLQDQGARRFFKQRGYPVPEK